ncbi:MAG: TraR/DksA C4-type zinc finger protein, partial [Phycisphaeraceae bacterium]
IRAFTAPEKGAMAAAKKVPSRKTPSARKAVSVKSSAKSNGAAHPKGSRKSRSVPVKVSKPPLTAIAAQVLETPEPPSLTELRKAAAAISRKEKNEYRKLLMEKRGELLGDVESLREQALESGGNLSNMPLHMADVGSDQYEQEAMLGLVESERKLLREIDDAILRLDNGTFGVCVETGKPIGKPRLDIKPWAKYCIEVVREREKQGRF